MLEDKYTSTTGKPRLIVIVGPTASGKTALSLKLAKKFNGEIISADSRAIYKGLDIGSAKPGKKEMAEMKAFANRSATSTIDAIGKKCLRSAVEHKDWDDDNVQRYLRHLRD